MDIYVVEVMGCTACAYTEYSAAIKHVLSTIADLTDEPFTGSTEEELYRYLDDNCDVASLKAVWLSN